MDIKTNDPKSTEYRIKLFNLNIKVITKEFLKSRNVPEIASITISSEDYINESKNITEAFWEYHVSISAINFSTGIKILT